MTHTLVIPDWHPVSVNRLMRCHWHTRRRMLRRDADMIAVYARAQGIPRARGKRRVSVTYTIRVGETAADPDNRLKSLLDGLVKAGLLFDDSPRWCELGQVRSEMGERGTTIVLEDL